MIQKLSTPISVTSVYNHKTRTYAPQTVLFEGNNYAIKKVGYHHTYRDGRTLYHVFSVAGDTIFFRLVHNTDTLSWTLEEVADGEAN